MTADFAKRVHGIMLRLQCLLFHRAIDTYAATADWEYSRRGPCRCDSGGMTRQMTVSFSVAYAFSEGGSSKISHISLAMGAGRLLTM